MSIQGFVSVEEAAEMLGCTTARVRQLLGDGTLDGKKFGARVWLVSEETVTKYRDDTKENTRGRPRISGR